MPYLNNENRPSFLREHSPIDKPTTPDNKPKQELAKQPPAKKENPFMRPGMSKSNLAEKLSKDPDVIHQASLEGKNPRDFAKQLLERFSHLDPHTIEEQLKSGDYWKIQHKMQEGHNTPEKVEELKHEREESALLKEKFEVK